MNGESTRLNLIGKVSQALYLFEKRDGDGGRGHPDHLCGDGAIVGNLEFDLLMEAEMKPRNDQGAGDGQVIDGAVGALSLGLDMAGHQVASTAMGAALNDNILLFLCHFFIQARPGT